MGNDLRDTVEELERENEELNRQTQELRSGAGSARAAPAGFVASPTKTSKDGTVAPAAASKAGKALARLGPSKVALRL